MGQLLSVFLNILMPVFGLVMLAYFAGPLLHLEARTLSRLSYFILAPAFVFNQISAANIQVGLAVRMVLFIQAVFASCALVGLVVARLLRRPPQMVAAYVLVAVFANTGNFGLPIIQFKLGDEALAVASFYFVASIIIAFVIAVGAVSWNQEGGPGAALAVLKTPVLIVVPPALLVNWLHIELPLAVTRPIALLAGATVPLMLLTLGVQLAGIGFPRFSLDVIAASTIRLVVGPVLAVALAAAFGLLGVERGAGVLQASMPAAVLTSIIALEHNLLPDFVTATVLYSTLASVVTLTIVLAVM